jgi:hypothetical protein
MAIGMVKTLMIQGQSAAKHALQSMKVQRLQWMGLEVYVSPNQRERFGKP